MMPKLDKKKKKIEYFKNRVHLNRVKIIIIETFSR